MNKLGVVSYCLFVLGAIMFASVIHAYGQSLQPPPGCLLCPPIDYNGTIFGWSIAGLVFAGFGTVVMYADYENKKVAQRSRANQST